MARGQDCLLLDGAAAQTRCLAELLRRCERDLSSDLVTPALPVATFLFVLSTAALVFFLRKLSKLKGEA